MAGEPHIVNKFQEWLGISKGELLVAGLIAAGLAIGLLYQNFAVEEEDSFREDYYRVLDSLAEAHKTTYTGSDFEGNVYEEIAKGDTVVEKESFFPTPRKKELPDDKININTASITELQMLPGVGPATAKKIIAFRENTPFEKPEDIIKINGVGSKTYEKMKSFIRVN